MLTLYYRGKQRTGNDQDGWHHRAQGQNKWIGQVWASSPAEDSSASIWEIPHSNPASLPAAISISAVSLSWTTVPLRLHRPDL